MSYLLVALSFALIIAGHVLRKGALLLAAVITWAAFSFHVSTLDMDITLKSGMTAFGGIMVLYCAFQSLYVMGILPRQQELPEDTAREKMQYVRRQITSRRINSKGNSDELSDFDRAVYKSQRRLVRKEIRRRGGYRLG